MVFSQEIINKAKDGTVTTTSYSTGSGAENIVTRTEKKNDGTTEIHELDPRSIVSQQRGQRKQQLEAKKQETSEVNWLGSSYSGQDIKVVAHLYGSTSEGKNIKEDGLREDLSQWEAIETATNNLLNGTVLEDIGRITTTFEDRRDAIERAMALKDSVAEQRARGEINKILNSNSISTPIGRAKLKVKLLGLVKVASSTKTSINSEIAKIIKIQKLAKPTLTLGSIQTLSVQSHREKFAVRALGHSYAKGYVRGSRSIAGSMIFTLFDEHPLKKLITAMGDRESIWRDPEISTLIPDQLPPIDITLVFANEYGSLSRMSIYGVEFINDGVTFSVDDLLSEAVMQFVARDVDIMTKAGQVRLSKLNRGMGEDSDITATSLLAGNDSYNAYLDSLKIRRRLVNR